MSTVLILISAIASIYYMFVGVVKPETVLVYSEANVPLWGIQVLSFILGVSGAFLLFPKTFELAGTLMILHSLITIGCFLVIRDYKGGLFEFAFLQIPVLLLWVGYPILVLEKFKNLFT
jgi:hypothetical protein